MTEKVCYNETCHLCLTLCFLYNIMWGFFLYQSVSFIRRKSSDQDYSCTTVTSLPSLAYFVKITTICSVLWKGNVCKHKYYFFIPSLRLVYILNTFSWYIHVWIFIFLADTNLSLCLWDDFPCACEAIKWVLFEVTQCVILFILNRRILEKKNF